MTYDHLTRGWYTVQEKTRNPTSSLLLPTFRTEITSNLRSPPLPLCLLFMHCKDPKVSHYKRCFLLFRPSPCPSRPHLTGPSSNDSSTVNSFVNFFHSPLGPREHLPLSGPSPLSFMFPHPLSFPSSKVSGNTLF